MKSLRVKTHLKLLLLKGEKYNRKKEEEKKNRKKWANEPRAKRHQNLAVLQCHS